MKHLIKTLKENAELKKANEELRELCENKTAQVNRYIKTVARLENQIEALKEDNLRLEGKLTQQEKVSRYLSSQNADLLLENRSKMPKVTKLTVTEVKTGT